MSTTSLKTRAKAKCNEVLKAVILFMKNIGIAVPVRYQQIKVLRDLPAERNRKETEMLRRFQQLNPMWREHVTDKVNDLLVYAEAGKLLNSQLIALIALKKLKMWENQLQNLQDMPAVVPTSPILVAASPSRSLDSNLESDPKSMEERRKRKQAIKERNEKVVSVLRRYEEKGLKRRCAVTSIVPQKFGQTTKPIILPKQTLPSPGSESRIPNSTIDLSQERRKDIEKYREIGAIKKKLHSIPEYERDLKGPKLPKHKLGSPGKSKNDSTQLGSPRRRDPLIEIRETIDRLNQKLSEARTQDNKHSG